MGSNACSQVAPPSTLFPREWRALEQGLSRRTVSEPQVAYLRKFPVSAGEMLRVWSAAAEDGYSTRVRINAIGQLATFAQQPGALAEGDLPAWRAAAARLTSHSAVLDAQFPLITLLGRVAGATAAENAASLQALSKVLHTPVVAPSHPFAVCTAYALTAGDDAAWQAFVQSVDDAELNPPVRAFWTIPRCAAAGPCALRAHPPASAARSWFVGDEPRDITLCVA